jgi:hypothetical protein
MLEKHRSCLENSINTCLLIDIQGNITENNQLDRFHFYNLGEQVQTNYVSIIF